MVFLVPGSDFIIIKSVRWGITSFNLVFLFVVFNMGGEVGQGNGLAAYLALHG